MLRPVACPPQHRPRIPGRRSTSGRHTIPATVGTHDDGAHSTHRLNRRDQPTPGCCRPSPRYTVGTNPTDRHNSITNWLNSGARASSDSSSGSARQRGDRDCRPAAPSGWLTATSTPSGSSRNNSEPPPTGPATPDRAPHPVDRPPAAGTARARPPRSGGSPGPRTAAAPPAESTASSHSWRRRPPPADWASNERPRSAPRRRPIDVGEDLPRVDQESRPGRAQPHVVGGPLQQDHVQLAFQPLQLLTQRRTGRCARGPRPARSATPRRE